MNRSLFDSHHGDLGPNVQIREYPREGGFAPGVAVLVLSEEEAIRRILAHEGLVETLQQCLHWTNLDGQHGTIHRDVATVRREHIEAALALARGQ